MKKYIKDLTDHIIGEHSLDKVWEQQTNWGGPVLRRYDSLKWLQSFLSNHVVSKIQAPKLGIILGEIEEKETKINHPYEEDCLPVEPSSNRLQHMRNLVAHDLAIAIAMRLWPESIPMERIPYIPLYKNRMKPHESLFVKFAPSGRGYDVALFRSGEGNVFAYSRDTVCKCSGMGHPIYSELNDNWPS